MNIDVLKQISKVYCHGHCPDGLASAMILNSAFKMLGTAPEIVFLVHGTPEHQEAGLSDKYPVLFCDIAPMGPLPRGSIVLDHHVGAKDVVQSFGELGVYADAELEPGVSGAVLAYRHVYASVLVVTEGLVPGGFLNPCAKDFAECVGVRDTWQTKHPKFERGQWVSKLLMSKPAEYWIERNYVDDTETYVGKVLFEAHEEAVRQAVDQCALSCHKIGPQKYFGAHVFQEHACGFRLTSDVAEKFRASGEPGDIVAGFSYVVDKVGREPRLLYSLRSLGNFDVCAFAKANGGGGHKAAAGFSVPVSQMGDPYQYLNDRLVEYWSSVESEKYRARDALGTWLLEMQRAGHKTADLTEPKLARLLEDAMRERDGRGV